MNTNRKNEAWKKRNEANQLANQRPTIRHKSNGDEQKFRGDDGKPSYLMSFTKGLCHDEVTGLLKNSQDFQKFVTAVDSGNPRDFQDTPLGPDKHIGGGDHTCKAPTTWKSKIAQEGKGKFNPAEKENVGLRAWESQSAGLTFELEGPDAQSVTMPPAPILGSAELTAEMAEVYAQALLRDVPLNALSAGILDSQFLNKKKCDKIPPHGVVNQPVLGELLAEKNDVKKYLRITEQLKKLDWFSGNVDLKLTPKEEARRYKRLCPNPSNAFRGITKGDDIGPYLSQFLLIGNKGINGNDSERNIEDGKISYGAISIEQKVRVAKPNNYMTKWEQWLDVQNAASVGGLEDYEVVPTQERRFIYTPRDLATYVHYDALYEAYLNACLIMLGNGVSFDPGIPFQEADISDHQQGFAHFGGPHILTLVTEVATRALKAVRYQKYNIHRRCRPEVLAARITKADDLIGAKPELTKMREDIGTGVKSILKLIDDSNDFLFENDPSKTDKNYLLPMAFTEGSPMHPSYGAGHATVAGACITVLKAFFDCNTIFKPDGIHSDQAYVSINNGTELKLAPVFDQNGEKAHLTIEGELNKLASNISIARNWAGVHYFTDYYESILMGEQIALGILEEQKLMFEENFSMTIPLFGGETIRI